MRNRLLFGLAVVVVMGTGGVAGAQMHESMRPPPDELAKYYPPTAKSRVYTFEMLELGRLLGATVNQAKTGHDKAALEEAKSLKAQYRKVAGMVGAWQKGFPIAPIEHLEQTIAKKGSADAVQAAAAKVEEVCTSCHVREMFRVQARFHWGKFSAVQATVDGASMSFHQVMMELSNTMAVIGAHAVRGQFDQAAKEAARLPKLFGALENSCSTCHTEKREYFVDQRAKGRLMRINQLVKHKDKDRKLYDAAVAEVNARSCVPCHQVHMPAAFLQSFWERKK